MAKELHIALIQPKFREWSPNKYVPLGLGYIAAVLENEGNDVEIIDMNVQKMTDKQLQNRVRDAEIKKAMRYPVILRFYPEN